MVNDSWQQLVKEYASRYNIPLLYLADTLSDPKVIPMIRGKAFEYSVTERLTSVLPSEKWIVDKPFMNAQSGLHDIDVRVRNKVTEQYLGLECKLAAKGRFRPTKDGYEIAVKCMRSRTLGVEMVRSLAPQLGIDPQQLTVHNDQYLDSNFDYVVTSIGNAFYQTDPDTREYVWSPNDAGKEFLRKLGADDETMKDFAFNQMYIATSKSLAVSEENGIRCTRRRCKHQDSCAFIPNYPKIIFDQNLQPTNGWYPIDKADELFSLLAG